MMPIVIKTSVVFLSGSIWVPFIMNKKDLFSEGGFTEYKG